MSDGRMGAERAATDGNVLPDRRRPGRRQDVSRELVALLRQPPAAEGARIEREIGLHDTVAAATPAPAAVTGEEVRLDLPHLLAALAAFAFCGLAWWAMLELAIPG